MSYQTEAEATDYKRIVEHANGVFQQWRDRCYPFLDKYTGHRNAEALIREDWVTERRNVFDHTIGPAIFQEGGIRLLCVLEFKYGFRLDIFGEDGDDDDASDEDDLYGFELEWKVELKNGDEVLFLEHEIYTSEEYKITNNFIGDLESVEFDPDDILAEIQHVEEDSRYGPL